MADHRAWLITWNTSKWQWDNLEEKCDETRNGKKFIRSWACYSSKPQIGEEVFLMKLGDHPRGIVGHGVVNRTSYVKEHYEPIKAADGKKIKAIDVEFDRLINYEQETILLQKELVDKCGAQHWSPQNSGIEIKQEVLPTLQALWNQTVRNNQNDMEKNSLDNISSEDDARLPEEIGNLDGEPIIEGAKKTITVNAYERDPEAKRKCKEYYLKRDGCIICQVCGFDFGKVYGSEYANQIHVHHIVPISEIGEEYVVDPVKRSHSSMSELSYGITYWSRD